MYRALVACCAAAALFVPAAFEQTQSTPRACAVTIVSVGGTQVSMITGPYNGCHVYNGLTATDQGGIGAAEPAYVNPIGAATLTGNTTTEAIAPGGVWNCPVPSSGTNPVSLNATTTNHKVTCTRW